MQQADEDIKDIEKQYESFWNASGSDFGTLNNDNRVASEIYASHLLQLFPEVTSVIDIGCGAGIFLNAFKKRAISVMGCDAHFPRNILTAEEFCVCDLSKQIPRLKQKSDLLLSFETAEHLPPERSESFIDDLCRLSDIIVFGAAVPNQHGLGHINERLASEWAELFQKRNYIAFDLIRPVFWTETRIPVWYRQNILIYVNAERREIVNKLQGTMRSISFPLDVCHPELYNFRINQYRDWLAKGKTEAPFYFFDLSEFERLIKRLFILLYLPKNAVGAELGVFRGHFSEYVLERIQPKRYYLVDPWTKLGEYWNWGKGEDYTSKGSLTTAAAKKEAENRTARFTSRTNVDIVEDYSESFLADLKEKIAKGKAEPLDFVYIDSSHEYEGTARELNAVVSCMAPGGVIAGDDWYPDPTSIHHGVYRAVTEFVCNSDWEIVIAGVDSQYLLRRKGK